MTQMQVTVVMTVTGDDDPVDVINDCVYDFVSNTPGARIKDTEIVDIEFID